MKQPFPFTGVSGSMSIVVRRISGTLPEPHIWVRSYLGDMIGTSSGPSSSKVCYFLCPVRRNLTYQFQQKREKYFKVCKLGAAEFAV